jgi:hypothetical protein
VIFVSIYFPAFIIVKSNKIFYVELKNTQSLIIIEKLIFFSVLNEMKYGFLFLEILASATKEKILGLFGENLFF